MPNFFQLNEDGSLNKNMFSCFLVDIFNKKYKINPVYVNANFAWGVKDPETGIWDGITGNVSWKCCFTAISAP